MDIKFTNAKIIEDNGYWLCLKTEEINNARRFVQEKKDKDYTATLKEYRKKRSLDANAYAWVLITEIAEAVNESKENVYVDMLKHYGQSQIVSVITEGAELFERTCKYCEQMGETILKGKEFTHFKVYTGSSEYNTKEMSILIDGIVHEAKNLEIETMTPEELERIKGAWSR